LQQEPDTRREGAGGPDASHGFSAEYINLVFQKARLELKKRKLPPENSLHRHILILDNLEKIERMQDSAEGEATQRKLLSSKRSSLSVSIFMLSTPFLCHWCVPRKGC